MSRGLLSRQLACSTDELSHDALHNQIIKSTLERLSRTNEIDPDQRRQFKVTARALSDVRSVRITLRDFQRGQTHGNNPFYGISPTSLRPRPSVANAGTWQWAFSLSRRASRSAKSWLDIPRLCAKFCRFKQRRFTVKSGSYSWRCTKTAPWPTASICGRGRGGG